MAPRLKSSKRGGNSSKLTAQQQVFIEAYFADRSMNANNAAAIAGYKVPGSAVLANPNVRAIVAKRLHEIKWEHRADRDRVLLELMSIAFISVQDLLKEDGSVLGIKEMPKHVASAIKSLNITYGEEENEDGTLTTLKNVKIDFWDKMYALDLLTKHLGMMNPVPEEKEAVVVDWDQLVPTHAISSADEEQEILDNPVEKRIKAMASRAAENTPSEAPEEASAGLSATQIKSSPAKGTRQQRIEAAAARARSQAKVEVVDP